MAEYPPGRLWLHELREMLAWFENNLCENAIRDPRDHFVKFSPERFPHLIKLSKKNSDKLVRQPQKLVQAIRSGKKTNADFGGYDEERSQTLTWITPTILRPTKILELIAQPLVGDPKAGDTLYVKEFERGGEKYKFKVLVCKRVGTRLLIPVTFHPRDHDRYSPAIYKQVWP